MWFYYQIMNRYGEYFIKYDDDYKMAIFCIKVVEACFLNIFDIVQKILVWVGFHLS